MPGMGMRLVQAPMLAQRLEQRQELDPDDYDPDEFQTDGEKVEVSQYEILKKLNAIIEKGEFIDKDHFELEVNRTIFGSPLEARIGTFGRSIQNLVNNYTGSEEVAKEVLTLLGSQQDQEKKDVPGSIALAWEQLAQSQYFSQEQKSRVLMQLVKNLSERKADTVSALELLSSTSKLEGQGALVQHTKEKVDEYSSNDARLIPYAHKIVSPLLKAIRFKNYKVSSEQAKAIYQNIIEQLFMLDRDLRVSGISNKIADRISVQGLQNVLQNELPVPLYAALSSLNPNPDTVQRILELSKDESFMQGREIKRSIYRGLASLEELTDGEEILNHAAKNASEIKSFAKILSGVDLVHKDNDFSYPFELTDENSVIKNLRLQLVDRSVKRLGLDDASLEQYLARLETDDKFKRIGEVITTLAGYQHYSNDSQLSLLKEITKAELDGKFKDWRYSHNRSQEQIDFLEKAKDGWVKNASVTRIIGAPETLQTHVNTVRNALPMLYEAYTDYFKANAKEAEVESLASRLTENEQRLRGEMPNKERKQLGIETSRLREQISYTDLLHKLEALHIENYSEVLDQSAQLSKKRSRGILFEHANWIRETLDQPEYREARRIQVVETDDLETLLKMGESPVPHCQNWKVDSKLNRSLLSFVADSNKKLYQIRDIQGNPIAMSLVRVINWHDNPTLLVENAYGKEWNNDYGVALFGSIADKAAALSRESGRPANIATNNSRVEEAMRAFSNNYNVEIWNDNIHITPPRSKNAYEYWDCGPGLNESGKEVAIDVRYVTFGGGD